MSKLTEGYLSPMETMRAVDNLNAIESRLGYKVPSGMINMGDLSDHYLSPLELMRITDNIRSIENRRYIEENRKTTLFEKLVYGYMFILLIVAVVQWIASGGLF